MLSFSDRARRWVISCSAIVRVFGNVLESAFKSTGIWLILIVADLVDNFVCHLYFFYLALEGSVFLIQLVVPIFKHPLSVGQVLRINFLFNMLISSLGVVRSESDVFYRQLYFIFDCASCDKYFTEYFQHNRAHFKRILVEILFLRFSWLNWSVDSWRLRYQTLVYPKIADTNFCNPWWFLSWRTILDVFLLEKKI